MMSRKTLTLTFVLTLLSTLLPISAKQQTPESQSGRTEIQLAASGPPDVSLPVTTPVCPPPIFPPAPSWEPPKFGALAVLKGPLSLTDDQYHKLAEVEREYYRKTSVNTAQLRDADEEMDRLVMQDQLDVDKLKAVQGKINAMRSELANDSLDYRIAQQRLLSEMQRRAIKLDTDKKTVDRHGLGQSYASFWF